MLAKVLLCAMFLRERMHKFVADESGEVNIVAIVVLIGIAVLLAVIFRGQIENLLNTLFNRINETAVNAVT